MTGPRPPIAETSADRLARLRARVQQSGAQDPASVPVDAPLAPAASGEDPRARLAAIRRGIDDREQTATNPVSDAAAQVLAAPAKMVTTFGEGALRLADMGARALGFEGERKLSDLVTGEQPRTMFARGADALRQRRETINEVVAPETRTGRVAQVTSDIAANVLPYVASGGSLGLARGAAASAALSGVQSAAGRDASTVGMLADVTDDEGATGTLERIAEDPRKRVAADVALDVGISAATAGLGGAYQAAKRSWREAAAARSARARPAAPPEVRALPAGQYEMPAVREAITDPSRLLPAEAAGLPRPRTQYESPTGPAIPMPADVDAARMAAADVASAASPEDVEAYVRARERGSVLTRTGNVRVPRERALEREYDRLERAAMQEEAPSAKDYYDLPLEDLSARAPSTLPSNLRSLSDADLMSVTALRQRRVMDDFGAAALLDDPRIQAALNEAGSMNWAKVGATKGQLRAMRKADREHITGLLGAPEEARLAQRLGLTEEGLARLEESGKSLYDLETALAASKRLDDAQRTLARLEDEVERRGLVAGAGEDVSFDFGANAPEDAGVSRGTPRPSPVRGLARAVGEAREAPRLRQSVQELTEQRDVAQRAAETDALTGLGNQGAFRRALPAAEADPGIAVVRFDANGFKGVNDALGHQAGDQTLREMAEAIQRAAGAGARVFRVGGDEFAILAPKAEAERVLRDVEAAYGVREVAPGVRTSISGGVGETDAAADAAATSRKAEAKAAQGIPERGRRSSLPAEVRGATAFDIGGVTGAALKTRPGQSVALGAVGAALTEAEDERIQNTGRGLIALAALHAGAPVIRAGGRAAGRAAKGALQESPLGRKVLDAISHDIQAKPEVKAVVEAFEQETAKGRARSLELANRARRLGPEADRTISDLNEREGFEQTALDPAKAKEAAAVAQAISDEFTQLGRAKVRAGTLSAPTVAKREGRYLPRVYGERLAEDVADDLTLPMGTRRIRIKGEKIRNDELRPETRNLLGEVREASYRTQVGLERGYRDVAAARLFSSLREMPGVVHPEYAQAFDALATARAAYAAAGDDAARVAARQQLRMAQGHLRELGDRFEKAREGFVRMPDTPAMGALRGAVVRKDVADYLNMVPNLQAPQGVFRNILSFWKRAHTVWNPGTHVGNTMSNAAMAHMGGLSLIEQPAALAGAIKDVRAYGPTTRYLAERGVLERGLPTFGEGPAKGLTDERTALRSLASTTRPETRAALARGGVQPMGRVERGVRGVASAAERAYSLEDAVYRVALFQKLRAQGMPEADAATFVQKQFVDYATRSPVLGAIKNTVSPFVLYPAKAVPRVLEQIVEHPVRWATLAALWAGMDQVSRRKYGAVEEKDLRPNQRQGRYTGYLLPGAVQVDAAVRPAMAALGAGARPEDKYVFDVARWTPLSAITGSPAPGSLSFAAFGERAPAIMQPGGPLVDMGARLTNTDPFTGEDWLTEADSPADKAMKVLGGAASFVGPSALSYHLPRVVTDLRNEDPAAALVDAAGFVGLRPQVVRPGMQAMRERTQFERARSEVLARLRQDMRKAKSEERRTELKARAEARIRALAEEYRQQRQ